MFFFRSCSRTFTTCSRNSSRARWRSRRVRSLETCSSVLGRNCEPLRLKNRLSSESARKTADSASGVVSAKNNSASSEGFSSRCLVPSDCQSSSTSTSAWRADTFSEIWRARAGNSPSVDGPCTMTTRSPCTVKLRPRGSITRRRSRSCFLT